MKYGGYYWFQTVSILRDLRFPIFQGYGYMTNWTKPGDHLPNIKSMKVSAIYSSVIKELYK